MGKIDTCDIPVDNNVGVVGRFTLILYGETLSNMVYGVFHYINIALKCISKIGF